MCVLTRTEIGREGRVPLVDLYLTCMEPTLKSAAILMKFTQECGLKRKDSGQKIFEINFIDLYF